MGRKRAAEALEDEGLSQEGSSQAPFVSDEAEKLASDVCRFVLLREHMRKPVSRADIKATVFGPERKDPGGKLMKSVLALANMKLKAICGLELVADTDAGLAAEEDGNGTQTEGASQSQTQATQGGASQGAKSGQGKYLLVNQLPNVVQEEPSSEGLVYHALVEVVLGILHHNDGTVTEVDLWEIWLKKFGLEESTKLPQCSVKLGDLVNKKMLPDGYIRRSRTGHISKGPRSVLSRSSSAADQFKAEKLDGL